MMLCAVQFASAQKPLYVISKLGAMSVYPADRVTFDDDFFTFTYGEVTDVTESTFSTSFNVALKSDDCQTLVQSPEVGICFSYFNDNPTVADGKIKEGSSLKEYTFSINALDAGTTYYYRAYVKLNDVVYYGDVQSQPTAGAKQADKYTVVDGHNFVDLGLPSGLLWAATNIGAATAADDGGYYAWAETSPKSYYYVTSYKYGTSLDYRTITMHKYTSTDGKTTLDKEDDAAYVNWGSSCRMPTNADFEELLNSANCTWTWTKQTTSSGSDIAGYKVTSVKNGKSIFFPATGHRNWSGVFSHGDTGHYWSSDFNSKYEENAGCLSFSSLDEYYRGNGTRTFGFTVRPVAKP